MLSPLPIAKWKISNIWWLVSPTTTFWLKTVVPWPRTAFPLQNSDFEIRRRKRERQRSNKFRKVKQQLCTCSTLFCTFLCRHCTTARWKYLISRFTEDVNKARRNFSALFKLGCSSQGLNPRRVCLHLTKKMRWNNCDEYWKNGNSFFKRRFHCRRRPRILRSLMTLVYARITRLRMLRSIFYSGGNHNR